MTLTERLDVLVERGAGAMEDFARGLAVDGGFRRQVAEELLDDAAFLRKLKPTKIAARARGDMPVTGVPSEPAVAVAAEPEEIPMPPPAPERSKEKHSKDPGKKGLNALAVVGVAFVAGIVLAKVIDWRGHAHPRQ